MPETHRVLTFPEYDQAGQALARALAAPVGQVTVHRFPDGESRVQVPTEPADHAILCRSLFVPNDKLIELLLTTETLRAAGVQRITLVAPYLCYMRQDAAFHPGEAVSQRIVGRFLARQLDALITVDPHLHRTPRLQQAVPAARVVALSAAPLLGPFLRQHLDDPLLLGPDAESEPWVQQVAEPAGLDYAAAHKQRRGDTSVQITLPNRPFAGRDVVLVDDVVSTGRTLAEAARQLFQAGARSVRALVTHALFAGDAEACIRAAGVRDIWSTDSIPHSSNRIALAELLATQLR